MKQHNIFKQNESTQTKLGKMPNNLTQKGLERLKPTGKHEHIIDKSLPAFKVRMYPTGRKVFIVQKRLPASAVLPGKRNDPITVTIGEFPHYSVKEARDIARQHISTISKGQNPNEIAKADERLGVTLYQAFKAYCGFKKLKESTIEDYERHLNEYLIGWRDKPLILITPALTSSWYKKYSARSVARANGALRLFNAVYDYTRTDMEDEHGISPLPKKPSERLRKLKVIKKVKRKKRLLDRPTLPRFLVAVRAIKHNHKKPHHILHQTYVLTLLMTGLRYATLSKLAVNRMAYNTLRVQGELVEGWYDDRIGVFHLRDQKNGEEQEIPVSTQVVRSLALLVEDRPNTRWLFERNDGDVYKYDDSRNIFKWIDDHYNIRLSGSDFRRTYLTIAVSIGVPEYVYKTLVGHKIDTEADVTGGYIVLGEDVLRDATQKISDALFAAVKKPQLRKHG